VGLGWAVTFILLAAALLALRRADRGQLIPQLGIVSALLVVVMSTEIVPIAYHVNLTVLGGIILGPAAGFLSAFIVDIILALFGHSGVTVVGLNTLIIGAECVLGYTLFHLFVRALRPRIGLAAGLATVLTLFLTTSLSIGIVALSNVNPTDARDTGALNPATLSFSNPLEEGLLANRIVTPEQEVEASSSISVARFAIVVYGLGSVGWVLEGLVIGYLVAFIARVRPGLLRHPLLGGLSWT
ncbi:MAG TPA: energy-coupling factor ABC transporter permease, partial [Thermoleophilia bacterium]|nr:energy-coupling factor ABC transporter permease [Thermoleophilia bacterium]